MQSGLINEDQILKDYYELIKNYDDCNSINYVINHKEIVKYKYSEKNHFGNLSGMVFSIKDIFAQKNLPLTCSSKMLSEYISPYNADIIKLIKNNKGMISSRTNCDEFAMGSTNESSFYGAVKNPHNKSYVSGGSSGGAAVSVSKNFCDVAIGSDTGGSIRIPASYCGVFGFKPTYGKISRNGMVSFAPSFDTVGLMSKSIDLIITSLKALSEFSSGDMTSNIIPKSEFNQTSKKRILIPANLENYNLFPELIEVFNKIRTRFQIEEKETINFFQINLAYYAISLTETASNLSRFDGIKFGFNFDETEFNKILKYSRSNGFGEAIIKRIILGNYILFKKQSLLKKALKIRQYLQNIIDKIFNEYDYIILPVTNKRAPKLGTISSQSEMLNSDIFTTLANLTGIPAISIPAGFDSNGIPFGIQILAKYNFDYSLLNFSDSFYKKLMD